MAEQRLAQARARLRKQTSENAAFVSTTMFEDINVVLDALDAAEAHLETAGEQRDRAWAMNVAYLANERVLEADNTRLRERVAALEEVGA